MQKTPIAIIGIGCRFPNVNNHREFWDLLVRGEEAHRAVDFCEIAPKVNQLSAQQFVDVDHFDADFFNIASQSAEFMDPQQRLLLEVAWETFEDAGQVPQDLAGSNTGVFIGINNTNYYDLLGIEARQQFEVTTGNQRSLAANRLSYFFDFQGVSMAIDTACSSSLVAVDRACRSLWTEESDLALAGGVNLVLTPQDTTRLEQAGLIAADGRCKVFDATADGYVRSDGIGLVLLKPLPQAQTDGDRIYAVIRGSSVNHNGRSNGLTAPNLQAQVNLLTKAYQQADIQPTSVHYVEAHATGTSIGDALELKAIGRVLGKGRSPENFCHVGSVKTNLGHTETASGIAGLIKIALIAHYHQLPTHLHLQEINPAVNLAKLGLQIPQTLQSIPNPDLPFCMGVSAFGLGGTNVHTVLQSLPQIARTPLRPRFPLQIFLLSAKTKTALQTLAHQYQIFCQQQPNLDLETLCCNVNTTRTQFPYRFCAVVASLAELEQQLQNYLDGKNGDRLFIGNITKRQRKNSLLSVAQEIINISSIETLTTQEFRLNTELFSKIFLNFCSLWSEGYHFDWKTLYPPQKYPRLSLPSYPFERKSFWIPQSPTPSIQTTPINTAQQASIFSAESSAKKANPSFSSHFVPPKTNLEKQLVEIWQKILNVTEIGVQDNFFDLGGNSKLSIQLTQAIETAIQRKLPLAALFELTTIAQQANLIENEPLEATENLPILNAHIPQLTPEEYQACLSVVVGRLGTRPNKYSLIVCLNPKINTKKSTQPFFYCANSYKESKSLAAALGETRPFYLLESGYSVFRKNNARQIKALATRHVQDILQVQSEGSYVIGGYSFGTFVAYEVAQQLRGQGKKVDLLAIFDRSGDDLQFQKASRAWFYGGDLFNELWRRYRETKTIFKLNSVRNQVSQDIAVPDPSPVYQFEPYGDRLVLFIAKQSLRNRVSNHRKPPLWFQPRVGWSKDIVPNLEVHVVSGDHFSMMREPHVQSLVNKLKAYLED